MSMPPGALVPSALFALLAASAPAAAAEPGWSAVQRSIPQTGKEQRARLTYGHHTLRVDLPGQRILIEFGTGAMTLVNVSKKEFARVTLEALVALREKQMKMVRARLEEAPPEVRAQMEAQLDQAEAAARRTLRPKATEETGEYQGVDCRYYTWSSGEGEGRACIATGELPFDPSAFQKDSAALAEKMGKMGAGSAASSMAILELGARGFPLWITERRTLGSVEVEVETRFEELKPASKPASYFEPPAKFRKRDFEAMMREGIPTPSAP